MINFIKRRFGADDDAAGTGAAAPSQTQNDAEKTLFTDLQVQIPKLFDNFSSILPGARSADPSPSLDSSQKLGGSVGNIPQQVAAQTHVRSQSQVRAPTQADLQAAATRSSGPAQRQTQQTTLTSKSEKSWNDSEQRSANALFESSPTLNNKRTSTQSAPASPLRNFTATDANGYRTMFPEAPKLPSDDRRKVLLVIDDSPTDWSKYFSGKRIVVPSVDGNLSVIEQFEVRLEQAAFQELRVTSHSEFGAIVQVCPSGAKKPTIDKQTLPPTKSQTRTFMPDFVLVRQAVRNGTHNWASIITALDYAGVAGVNSLNSIYAFQDKPWIFSQLLKLKRKLGQQQFPVIEQTLFLNPTDTTSVSGSQLPVVVKIGHSASGTGKIRADSCGDISEAANVAASAGAYCTLEPFIESKCDLRVQKIGNNYKAFLRKSMSGNWKANVGSSMLEQVVVTDQQRRWIDDFSAACGGLDIAALKLVNGRDGRAYIIDALDSSLPLLGDSQEDDRRLIADLVLQRMQTCFSANIIRNSLNNQLQSVGVSGSSSYKSAALNDLVNSAGVSNTSIIYSDVVSSSAQLRFTSTPSDVKAAVCKSPAFSSQTAAAIASPLHSAASVPSPVQSFLNNAHAQAQSSRRVLPQEPSASSVPLPMQTNGSPHRIQPSATMPIRLQMQPLPSPATLIANRQMTQSPRPSIMVNSSSGTLAPNGSSSTRSYTPTYSLPVREREIRLNQQLTDSSSYAYSSRTLPTARTYSSQPLSKNLQQLEATEDTMQNLRTTFAGIFGEMPQ